MVSVTEVTINFTQLMVQCVGHTPLLPTRDRQLFFVIKDEWSAWIEPETRQCL